MTKQKLGLMALCLCMALGGSPDAFGAPASEKTEAAEAAGADYIGSGAVFGSSTKKNAKNLPLETLRDICASVSIPVVAIGGIGKENIRELAGCGIAGAAVVSAVFGAEDPGRAAEELLALSREIIRHA